MAVFREVLLLMFKVTFLLLWGLKLHFFSNKDLPPCFYLFLLVGANHGRKNYFFLRLSASYWKVLNAFTNFLIKNYQWWRTRPERNQTRQFQSAIVLCFERKSPFTIAVITDFLQNRKPHIHFCHTYFWEYPFYWSFLQLKESKKLIRLYQAENPFDRFAIKTVNKSGEFMAHLPKETLHKKWSFP